MKKEGGKNSGGFIFDKKSYIYLAIGVLVLVVGFLLMSGGAPSDPNTFNEEVFSHRRITLAPIIVLGGYGFIIWVIMRKPKTNQE
ncbi:MAG: DUF3098 domain-containing protein [Bacteroidales bacterium]|nr:DUF3098 domain-containing protein [Bacteroidales bacterium]